jgi:hypothetical protein
LGATGIEGRIHVAESEGLIGKTSHQRKVVSMEDAVGALGRPRFMRHPHRVPLVPRLGR